MNCKIIYIVSLLFLTNCTFDKPKDIQIQQSVQFLERSDSLVFKLNDSIPSDFLSLQYVENEDVIIVNGGRNILTWYKMTTGKAIKTKKFNREGPDGVGKMKDFYYHNKDSLFVFNSYVVMLIDANDHVSKRFHVKGAQEKRGVNTAMLSSKVTLKQAVLLDDHLIIPSSEDELPESNGYTSRKLITKLNLFSGIVKHYGGYSDVYRDGSRWTLEYCGNSRLTFVPSTKKFILSYPIDKHVYFTDDFESFEAKLSKSNYFDANIEYKKDMMNPIQRIHYFLNNYSYEGLLYDHYRNVYYRIALHPMNITEKEVEKAAMTKISFNQSFSLSLFSQDMEKIAEQTFSGEIFKSNSYIIHPKGLYIQSSNIYNADKRTFYLMKFNDNLF